MVVCIVFFIAALLYQIGFLLVRVSASFRKISVSKPLRDKAEFF